MSPSWLEQGWHQNQKQGDGEPPGEFVQDHMRSQQKRVGKTDTIPEDMLTRAALLGLYPNPATNVAENVVTMPEGMTTRSVLLRQKSQTSRWGAASRMALS